MNRHVWIFLSLISYNATGDVEPPARELFNLSRSEIKLESSTEKTRAILSIATPITPEHSFKVDISGTIGEDDKKGEFADLDGLAKGAKVKLSYRFTDFGKYPRLTERVYEKWSEIQSRLEDAEKYTSIAIQVQDAESEKEKIKKCKEVKECNSLMEKEHEIRNELKVFSSKNRSELDMSQERKYPIDYIFSLSANRDDFKVFNENSFESTSYDKNGFGAGFGIQFYLGRFTRGGFGFDFQRNYKQGGKSKEYCYPVDGGAGLTVCESGNASPIERKYTKNVYAKIGGYTENRYLKGWDFSVTHDFYSSKTGVSIPLYFFESGKGEVNAGIKFDFIINGDEKDNDADVLVFFGTGLDIF